MFRPLALFVGLRYTRAQRRSAFVSFISFVSMLGIALGVMVLITVLSVMNGFDQEIKQRIFSMARQVTLYNANAGISDWQSMASWLEKQPHVVVAAPYVGGQGLLAHAGMVQPALVTGIDPDIESRVSILGRYMEQGKLRDLKAGTFGIVIGRGMAQNLGLRLGDKLNLMIPIATATPIGVFPRYRRFDVVGIFEVGRGFGFENQLAFVHLNDAQKLWQQRDTVSGFHLKLDDLYLAPSIARQLLLQLPNNIGAEDWTQRFGALVKAVALEKNMMFLIMMLIIAVAAFNLVSSLVMVVREKRSAIAILRTLGASSSTILCIFIIQGFLVGLLGTLLGLSGGIYLTYHITAVVNFIQEYFHVQLISPGVYYLDYLPAKLQLDDVWRVCVAALGLSLLATLFPAWRAAKTPPAEALRYE